jgi:hypothetical protein
MATNKEITKEPTSVKPVDPSASVSPNESIPETPEPATPDALPVDSSYPQQMGPGPGVVPAPPIEPIGKNPVDRISKIYQLKLVFSKLESLKSIFDKIPDPKYDEIKKEISNGIKIFSKIIVPNLSTYNNKLNGIIRKYNTFINNITDKAQSIKGDSKHE